MLLQGRVSKPTIHCGLFHGSEDARKNVRCGYFYTMSHRMDTEDIATNAIREMILTSEHHQYRLPREETLRTRRQTHEMEKRTADGALRLSRSAVKEDNSCVQVDR